MDQAVERAINDGSGMTDTFRLSDAVAHNIVQWINDAYDSDEDTYEWTESDIIDYIDETYPEVERE